MLRCSHGIPFEIKCPMCLEDALNRERQLNVAPPSTSTPQPSTLIDLSDLPILRQPPK